MRYLIPIALVLVLVGFLAVGLKLDPRKVPSPLVGKPMPAFSLPSLDGSRTIDDAALRGRPLLVNYWASWCRPCLEEHPLMMQLAARGDVNIVGINYKDSRADAQRWLARHGNPFSEIAQDAGGVAGLDWGVYGVPETFVIDAGGSIVYKQIGPMTVHDWQTEVAPRLGVRP